MERLKRRIVRWAQARPEIRAILMVGSRARRPPAADEWADLDLHLFCTDRAPLVSRPGWLEGLGEVWTWLLEEIEEDVPQLLVLFEDGEKVDFAFFPKRTLESLVATRHLDEIHDRGFVPLLDKDGLVGRLPEPSRRGSARGVPSEEAFRRVVNVFWYGAVYVAKQIRRGNLWVAQHRSWTMKEQLLRVMEWHARALHGPEKDTYHDGHLLSSWTDVRTWEELHGVFGGFSVSESWRVLLATQKLFRRLATRTALLWKYDYPTSLDRKVSGYVQDLYWGDQKT